MTPKLTLFALMFSVAGTATLAETYRCVRDALSTTGFSSSQAAESWFPKIVEFEVTNGEVRSDYYGQGRVAEKGDRLQFVFEIDLDGSSDPSVIYTYIPVSSRYVARLGAKSNFLQTPGAQGRCEVS